MAFYDLKKKPALTTKEGEKETLYPSIVYSGTLSARKLLERASYGTGYTVGELEGALSIIMDTAARYIGEGYRVELGEFGYFAGKIKASRMVAKKTDIRAASIRFNGVSFRASKQFKMKSAGELERVPERAFRTSSQLNIEELERRMMMHLEQNGFITLHLYKFNRTPKVEGNGGLENIRGKRIDTKDGQRESDVLCEGRRQLYKQSTLIGLWLIAFIIIRLSNPFEYYFPVIYLIGECLIQ